MKRKKVQDKVKAQKVKAPVKNEKTGKKIENEEGTLLFFTMITFSIRHKYLPKLEIPMH
jgi:hypothetical protein